MRGPGGACDDVLRDRVEHLLFRLAAGRLLLNQALKTHGLMGAGRLEVVVVAVLGPERVG